MRIALLILLLATPLWAQNVIQCQDQPNLACALQAGAVGVVPHACSGGAPVVGSVDANGNIGCVAGGSGTGAPNLIGAHTLTLITASSTLFMVPDSGIDTSEQRAQVPVTNSVTFQSLSCSASAPITSGAITVSGRQGTCGNSLADISAFTCTINNSTPVCNSGAAQLSVPSGTCWSLKVVTTGIPSSVAVGCTLERVA